LIDFFHDFCCSDRSQKKNALSHEVFACLFLDSQNRLIAWGTVVTRIEGGTRWTAWRLLVAAAGVAKSIRPGSRLRIALSLDSDPAIHATILRVYVPSS